MKSLMKFNHINVTTVDEAVSLLKKYADKACVLAGGTDLLGTMRFEILRNYPETVINLKTIPGLDYIKEEDDMVKIGALTRLQDIADNPVIKSSAYCNQQITLLDSIIGISRAVHPEHIQRFGQSLVEASQP